MPGQTVILTHEHADFDALASLLGGALLFPLALPVLPQRSNRNVQAFLSLYKNQFPFIEPGLLPRGPVDLAVLVDTRRFNAVKGMSAATSFLVIDHHSPEDPLPAGWTRWPESLGSHATGANATLLVERMMQQKKIGLTSFQATLLALGIYEDTGSLTYPATTVRDFRCAAWLVEQGARLEVVRKFINYPPTAAQQQLARRLVEEAEDRTVAGQRIVLAATEAPKYKDELSSVASGLWKLLEPSALFVVAALGDHVQVVARSGSDAIDVGKVCKLLGGGGHARAAAAVLPDQTLQDTKQRINGLLEEHVRPPATVSQIMSRGRPRTLDQEMTVSDAMELMQRYGHEGFPVLEGSAEGGRKLVGILTRREADRTLGHRLGALPVHKVMRQGNHTIGQDEPVSALHRVMIESGWGQIPVIDAAGDISGIVTRTDLLKLWGEDGAAPSQEENVGATLARCLSEAQHRVLKTVGEEAAELGQAVHLVGGFVRDLLLGQVEAGADPVSLDMDLVVEGDAIRLAKRMQARCGGRVAAHARFGTAKWILNAPDNQISCCGQPISELSAGKNGLPGHFDFATARTEFYTEPTALPTVEQGSIRLDLHRRDFTINTLAIALSPQHWGDLLDFYGGLSDLRAGQVRVLHSLSFVDDPTRILRAVRYEQRFGFQIEARTEEHLLDAAPLLKRVTGARIRHEFERIFQEARPEDLMARLDAVGVLRQIHPELQAGPSLARSCRALRAALSGKADPSRELSAAEGDGQPSATQAVETLPDPGWPVESLYWGLLTFDILSEEGGADDASAGVAATLSKRLLLRGETRRVLQHVQKVKGRVARLLEPVAAPSVIVGLLDGIDPKALLLLAIRQDSDLLNERMRCYWQSWRHVKPTLDGKALQRMGLKRGPLYGVVLRSLRQALLDGEITGEAQERQLAEATIQSWKTDS